ncbi:MAG: alpha-glucosidase C-terminal domain-containing protein [Cyclobacteriaceae bacterium]|nr:alpha-glucosidase C-terminal domain-containing protein [Cyclobacteriaceae bacterium]
MKRKTWFFIGSLALLSACRTTPELRFNDQELMTGLATPVLLAPGPNELVFEDFVTDVSRIDSIQIQPSVPFTRNENRLVISGPLPTALGNVLLWSAGQAYAIPLQRASKLPVTLRYPATAGTVKAKGEFNSWNPEATVLTKTESEFTIDLQLNPGTYQYLFVADGKEKRDPANRDSVDNGMGGWNSVLRLPRPDPAKLPLIRTEKADDGTVSLTLSNPATEVNVYWKNFRLPASHVTLTDDRIEFEIPAQARESKRSFIRVWAANEEGVSNDVLIPLHEGEVVVTNGQLTRHDKEAQVLYFMMVDRFVNGRPENDEPVKDKTINPKANYFGGDLAGITKKIKDGYFEKLGINTLWLSPITQNPKGAYGKYPTPPTTFSGYHGYWPISLKQIDYRYGSRQELEELLNEAHAKNINVILDYVAHHVHQEHPLVRQHPEWFTSLYLPDGSLNTERWEDQRLTTWFDVFLPTLDLRKPEVVGPMTDTALYWLTSYELDGFRHDASKHIDLLFWRELTKKIKRDVKRPVYQIGETYGSRELVSSYVNTGMLDGQFDFNVYDDAVNTFARDEVPFTRLANSVKESLSWFGDHHLMGNITGNQDRARFISYADGSVRFDEDAKKAGWTRTIAIQDTLGYHKLQSLTAFMMTIPGVPVIYYGDEIGDPGANDPDNRRMMRFENLNKHELKTRQMTSTLTELRRANLALLYGDLEWQEISSKRLVFSRSYFSDQVWVVFNKSGEPQQYTLPLADGAVPHFSGKVKFEKGQATLTLPPYSFEIITVTN